MKQKQQSELQNAFILLKCTKKTHDDCRKIRDALVENSSGYVQEAYTTNATISNTTWCVAASALVPTDESKKFEKHVRTIQTSGNAPIGVKELKVIMNRR